MGAAVAVVALIAGAYLVAVLEGWVSTGTLRPAGPLVSAAAMLSRESVVPRSPDRIFFEVAPPLLLVSAVLAAAVLPLAPGLIVADLATGALFVNAALTFVMVALVMAGWGPDGAYAMVGGFRFLGQLIGYSMLIVMSITAVAMRAESLLTTDIVASQAALPNAVYQPLGLATFFLAGMMVCFLPPFDLAVARGEIAGGVEAEYSGWRLATFRAGRAVLIVTVATATSVFYFGGWLGPVLPPWAWGGLKALAVAAVMLAIGAFVPRIKEEQLLAACWKVGIPLALFNIFYVGVLLITVGG